MTDVINSILPAASGDAEGIAASIDQMLDSTFALCNEPLPADCYEVLYRAAALIRRLAALSARDAAGAVGAIDENGEPYLYLSTDLPRGTRLYAEPPPASGEAKWSSDWSPEDACEQFIAAEIDAAPEAARRLGEYLARVLDEDHFKTADRMLLGAIMEMSAAIRESATNNARRLAAVAPAEEPPREYVQPDVINNDTLPAMQECMRCHRVSRADGPMLHMFGCKGENT